MTDEAYRLRPRLFCAQADTTGFANCLTVAAKFFNNTTEHRRRKHRVTQLVYSQHYLSCRNAPVHHEIEARCKVPTCSLVQKTWLLGYTHCFWLPIYESELEELGVFGIKQRNLAFCLSTNVCGKPPKRGNAKSVSSSQLQCLRCTHTRRPFGQQPTI